MPALVGWIIEAGVWLMRSRMGLMIASILAWAGITYGTQKIAVEPILAQLSAYMQGMSGGTGIGAAAWQWIGVLHFDVACSMLASAVATKMGVNAAKVVFLKAS